MNILISCLVNLKKLTTENSIKILQVCTVLIHLIYSFVGVQTCFFQGDTTDIGTRVFMSGNHGQD
jgi:hypothetical protein